MTGFATLTTKNQLTLPVELVSLAQISPGTKFWVQRNDDKIILEAVGGLDDMQGVLADHPKSKNMTIEEVIIKARKKKISRMYKE